jgi:hypothetical protein
MALTRIDMIDASLMRIGAEPLQSEAAAGADTHIAIFDSVSGYCLSANPFSWNTVTRKLVRLTAAPLRYWKYAFEKPSDMLGAPRAFYDNATCRVQFTEVELNDGVIQTNVTDLWMKMDKRSPVDQWPGYFVELIQVALMSQFALSVREDRALMVTLDQAAFGTPSENRQGGLMGVAMGIDAQGKPSPVVAMGRNPLTSARLGS